MKQCWVHLPEWDRDIVTEALESGADAIVTTDELVDRVRELGRIMVISPTKGDWKMPDDVEFVTISGKDDEERAAKALRNKTVVVKTTDWDIIPIENLIPRSSDNLFSAVRDLEDVHLASGIMEKGVAGVLLETDNPATISSVVSFLRKLGTERLSLEELEITGVKNIGIGDRVCVDTCTNLTPGEGLLTGNSSACMFLVHAENVENPYVAQRPFRVNAGAVHAYVKVPGDRTRYLGELETGDPVTIVRSDGDTYTAHVGRVKVEKRPLLVVYARGPENVDYSIILQNAETIRLTSPDGKAISVVKLQAGDYVLGLTEKGGRHFGMQVEESIIEK